MPRTGVPPLTQPLQRHFRGTKRTHAVPTSDKDANPFLASSLAAGPSTSASECIGPTHDNDLRGSRTLKLGERQATMLSLHSAVEHALVVHMATSGGGAVDASSSASSVVQLPNVVTFATLRPIVERSCGRRLGPTELARLMWLWGAGDDGHGGWAGCNIGFHVSRGKTMDRAGNKSYDYFLSLQVAVDLPDSDSDGDDGEAGERVRMTSADGQAIPSTPPRKRVRLLDLPDEPQTPSPSPRSIAVFARQPQLPTPPSSPSKVGKRARSVSANGSKVLGSPGLGNRGQSCIALVALWNNGIEARKREVRRRLVRWTLDCYATWQKQAAGPRRNPSQASKHASEQDQHHPRQCTPPPTDRRAVQGQGGMLTPSATREEGWVPGQKRVKDFFADEGKQGEGLRAKVREWDADFPLDDVAAVPQATLPESPAAPPTSLRTRGRTGAKAVGGAATTPATTTSARLTLAERIQAKEEARRSEGQSRASLGGDTATEGQCRSTVMANLQRKSALSRLQDVAESLYMLFSGRTTGTGRYPHLPINDVAKSLCNSSKVAMSDMEARQSLTMLRDIAPGFVEINKVGAREWVRIGAAIAGEEVQPGSGGLLGAVRRKLRAEMDRS